MAFINLKKKEVQVKIVYYGPGRGGKTTNLEYIYKKLSRRIKTEMVAIKTHGDRTLFFDFFPFEIGKIKGYDIKIQLYTVPGQVKYNATRKLVLRGVDGVVFVGDSAVVRREKTILSLENLKENLATYNKDIFTIPLVLQYNKRDLEDLLSIEELNQSLNFRELPHFSSIATQGGGVMETLEAISKLALQDIENRLTAGATVGPSENAMEEFSMTDEDLVI